MEYKLGNLYSPEEVTPKLTNFDKYINFDKCDLDYAIASLKSNDLKYIGMIMKEDDGFAIYVYATIANSSVKYQRKTELAYAVKNGVKFVSNKLYYTYLAGYRYYFNGMKKRHTYQFTSYDEEQPLMYLATDTECNIGIATWIRRDRYLKNKCLNDKKLKHIKFEAIENFWDVSDVAHFLKNITEHPAECEILTKQGYGQYIVNDCIFKGDKKKWIEKLKLLKKYGINKLDWTLLNFNLTYNKRGDIKNISYSDMKALTGILKATNQGESFAKYLLRYVSEQGSNLNEYYEFIKRRKRLNMAITERSAILPRNLNEEAKSLIELEVERNHRPIDERLKSTIVDLIIKSDVYSVYQPKVTSDFIRIGEEMSNCVGWNHYNEKVAKKACLIFEIFKDKTPYACLEVDGHGIQQLYLKKNKICDDETRKFVLKQIVPQTRSYFA